jgi:hypothetical protein
MEQSTQTERRPTTTEQTTQTGRSLEDDDDDNNSSCSPPDLDDSLPVFTGTLNTRTRVTRASPPTVGEAGRGERQPATSNPSAREPEKCSTKQSARQVEPSSLLHDMMILDYSIITDIENQHRGNIITVSEIDGDVGTTAWPRSDVVVAPQQQKHKTPKKSSSSPLKMGRIRKGNDTKQRMPFPELPYVDANRAFAENIRGMDGDDTKDDVSDFKDCRSHLSDEDADDGALAWTGTVWGIPGDDTANPQSTKRTRASSERLEERD